ncbi:GumC family protein [Bradyrhizobium sp. LHD-71]|uniref:GumC family protein n=1 Tax=Bradyrhizobium sp. LHD-71 TaxID=3072141 RepID=UPI0028106986|nr:GumC family protein [Bradyrhizobium sp. LHD-71]MDQ8726668.1 GumC family protein [Bradyrhizobium sp. LHD-71]
MSGRQTAAAPSERRAPPDRDSWDNPDLEPAAANTDDQSLQRLLSPSQLAAIVRANLKKIAALALALFVLGTLAILMFPARYTATSLVFVDPREQKVTNEQDVLPGIGQDAAALQSIIEIAKSDGFLRPVIEKLGVAKDTEISGGETNMARLLARFRSRLDVSRVGQTYVIAISFASADANRAAYYANALAEAFVAAQERTRAMATKEAADWLNDRLKDLRSTLTASEDAIAAFKTRHKIIDAGKDSTTRQLRATELSQQVSAARLRTEEAKSRYDQVQRDLKSNVETSTGSRSDLLTSLRAQRTQLDDAIAQRRAVLGDRHPEVVIALAQRATLERQIEAERRRIIQAARSDYEAQREQQRDLEASLNGVEREMLTTNEASVKLQELQLEADANRSIYEQFLSRYKTTSEQQSLQTSQTRIVSSATAPARPSRPSLPLLLAVTALGSLLASAAAVTLAAAAGVRLPVVGRETKPPSQASPPPAPDHPTFRALLDLPVWADMPAGGALASDGRPSPEVKRRLADLLERVALTRGLHGRVVLLLSGHAQQGRPAIAEALNALALDRGMLSVLIQIEPKSVRTLPFLVRAPVRDHTVMRTTSSALLKLLSGRGGSAGDLRSKYDIIVVDGTSLQDPAEIVALADQIDFAAFLVDEQQDGDLLVKAMEILSSKPNVAKGVIIDPASAGS